MESCCEGVWLWLLTGRSLAALIRGLKVSTVTSLRRCGQSVASRIERESAAGVVLRFCLLFGGASGV